MRRTNIKAIYRFSYGLGSLFLLLGLLLSVTRVPVQAYQDPGNLASGGSIEVWDKSSLVFLYSGACEGDCNLISAWVENHGSDMQGPTTFEVWYSATGNPMTAPDRQLVYTGVIPALPSGGTFQLTYVPTMTGNYKFRAIQREGHPGSGDLWSQTCYVICQEPSANPDIYIHSDLDRYSGADSYVYFHSNPDGYPGADPDIYLYANTNGCG